MMIVIGTGQSGPALARRLVAAGQKVAVIERKFFGGTCVNTGCTPTKTLVASAYAAHLARRAGEYGVTIPGPVAVDMRKVKARKDYVLGFSTRVAEQSEHHGLPGPRALFLGCLRDSRHRDAARAENLHQRRRPRRRARRSGIAGGRIPYQQHAAGCRFPP